MNDIYTIYQNKIGIAFKWKRCDAKDCHKVQLVFKKVGMYLSMYELKLFSKNIEQSKAKAGSCEQCKYDANDCQRLNLLESPINNVSFAMNTYELKEMEDLVHGTLFNLNCNEMIRKLLD